MSFQRNRKRLLLLIVIIGSPLLLVLLFIIAHEISAQRTAVTAQEYMEARQDRRSSLYLPKPEDHVMGSRSAPILLVEYIDLECPYCKSVHPVMEKLMERYVATGEVAWVLRNFPIGTFKKSVNETSAAECVAEIAGNDAYFKYISAIFKVTPSDDGLDPAELPKIAGSMGVDLDKFTSCLGSPESLEKVRAMQVNAELVKARPVPHLFVVRVSDRKIVEISGHRSFGTIEAVIQALQKS